MKKKLPRRVWVAFDNGFPTGVTKLASEAKEWAEMAKREEENGEVREYVLLQTHAELKAR